jgi:hypothetical protein
MAKEYGDSYEPEDNDENGVTPDLGSDEAPPHLEPGDLVHLRDGFLDDFQITETGQLKRTASGVTHIDKVDNMRKGLGSEMAFIIAAIEHHHR